MTMSLPGSLDSLLTSAMQGTLKFIFVGGKGGVGKTTTSSAIASLLATTCERRVLLVSTDPAHSLGDAWRTKFDNSPTTVIEKGWKMGSSSCASGSGAGYLEVMEIDPSSSMEAELAKWAEIVKTVAGAEEDPNSESKDGFASKISSFQNWLSGIPGIDEATALSAAISHIDSGKYDIIVFDTAPTGHTLKLLALPEILGEAIKKLQGWQTTAWTYWEAFKGFAASGSTEAARKRNAAREEVSDMLHKYQRDIGKVAAMLKDSVATAFVVVCIAEHLSVQETRRLLGELEKNEVASNHIVVNQLVSVGSSERSGAVLSKDEMDSLEVSREIGALDPDLMAKVIHACRLTAARGAIQNKYLNDLKTSEEAQKIATNGGIAEVPLLAEEVTGRDAIVRFGELLSTLSRKDENGKCMNADVEMKESPKTTGDKYFSEELSYIPEVGDTVTIVGLKSAAQYNGIKGRVAGSIDPDTGRAAVLLKVGETSKKLALLPKNMRLSERGTGGKNGKGSSGDDILSGENINKAKSLLDDPEIKAMIDSDPKVAAAVKDVMANPANFMKYMGDPELSGFLSKAMSKFMGA